MTKRTKWWLFGSLTFVGILLLSCCGGVLYLIRDRESVVTGNPDYPTDYTVGTAYTLQVDVFVLKNTDSASRRDHLFLIATYTNNDSIADYRKDPAKYPDVLGVLSAGTRLKLLDIVYHQSFEMSSVFPYLLILDGPLAGKNVDAGLISRVDMSWNESKVDAKYLK